MKHVATAYYVHKSNVNELIKKVVPKELIAQFYVLLHSISYPYDVIKYDGNNVTFIQSSNFLTAPEPLVEICYRYKENEWNKPPKIRKDFKRVYHHKWMFVADDFDGFDVEYAKERSRKINAIQNIDKKRIGNLDYWTDFVRKYNLD